MMGVMVMMVGMVVIVMMMMWWCGDDGGDGDGGGGGDDGGDDDVMVVMVMMVMMTMVVVLTRCPISLPNSSWFIGFTLAATSKYMLCYCKLEDTGMPMIACVAHALLYNSTDTPNVLCTCRSWCTKDVHLQNNRKKISD